MLFHPVTNINSPLPSVSRNPCIHNDIELRLINIEDKIQEIQDAGTREILSIYRSRFTSKLLFQSVSVENKLRSFGDRDRDNDNVES